MFQSLFLLDGRFDSAIFRAGAYAHRSFNPCFYWMGVLTQEWQRREGVDAAVSILVFIGWAF